jgi:phenylacetic acid degradation operon negative regulatory protein
MPEKVAPRSVVLNLVRVSSERTISVRHLIAACELFGLTANAVRVAVTRLCAEGLLESDERGHYRLGASAAALHEHVETWRRGEARMRPWRGEWLCVVLAAGTARNQRRTSCSALTRLGFREGLPALWLRPDNLRTPMALTLEALRALGLEDDAEPCVARDFSSRLAARLPELWPVTSLCERYARTAQSLSRSLRELPRMPRETALVQSFVLGGEAIRVLATDPLLPDELCPSAPRARLTELMLRYDALGRRIWRGFAGRPELSLIEGGRHA